MKSSPILLLTALLLAATVRGASFEGTVNLQRAELPSDAQDVVYRVKDDKVRVDVTGGGRVKTFLTNTAKKETTVILEDDMAYLMLPSLAPVPDGPTLEKTNETMALLGHTVQKYVFADNEGETELWLAEGFGNYTGFGEGFEKPPVHIPQVDVPPNPEPKPWEYALARQPLFPLRVISRDNAGREIFRLEVKTITPQPLQDRLFLPSVNYKKITAWPLTRP